MIRATICVVFLLVVVEESQGGSGYYRGRYTHSGGYNPKHRQDERPRYQEPNIVEVATKNGFSDLVSLVTRANLASTLQGEGPFTVFAPTNEAFKALPKKLLNKLLDNNELLKKVLLSHVVSGAVYSNQISDGQIAKSLNDPYELVFGIGRQGLSVNDDANIITADVKASNGVIHVIDNVLNP